MTGQPLDNHLLVTAMEAAYEDTKDMYRGYYIWELVFEMGKINWMKKYSYETVMKAVLKFLGDGHAIGNRYNITFIDSSMGTIYPKMKKIYFIPHNL